MIKRLSVCVYQLLSCLNFKLITNSSYNFYWIYEFSLLALKSRLSKGYTTCSCQLISKKTANNNNNNNKTLFEPSSQPYIQRACWPNQNRRQETWRHDTNPVARRPLSRLGCDKRQNMPCCLNDRTLCLSLLNPMLHLANRPWLFSASSFVASIWLPSTRERQAFSFRECLSVSRVLMLFAFVTRLVTCVVNAE